MQSSLVYLAKRYEEGKVPLHSLFAYYQGVKGCMGPRGASLFASYVLKASLDSLHGGRADQSALLLHRDITAELARAGEIEAVTPGIFTVYFKVLLDPEASVAVKAFVSGEMEGMLRAMAAYRSMQKRKELKEIEERMYLFVRAMEERGLLGMEGAAPAGGLGAMHRSMLAIVSECYRRSTEPAFGFFYMKAMIKYRGAPAADAGSHYRRFQEHWEDELLHIPVRRTLEYVQNNDLLLREVICSHARSISAKTLLGRLCGEYFARKKARGLGGYLSETGEERAIVEYVKLILERNREEASLVRRGEGAYLCRYTHEALVLNLERSSFLELYFFVRLNKGAIARIADKPTIRRAIVRYVEVTGARSELSQMGLEELVDVGKEIDGDYDRYIDMIFNADGPGGRSGENGTLLSVNLLNLVVDYGYKGRINDIIVKLSRVMKEVVFCIKAGRRPPQRSGLLLANGALLGEQGAAGDSAAGYRMLRLIAGIFTKIIGRGNVSKEILKRVFDNTVYGIGEEASEVVARTEPVLSAIVRKYRELDSSAGDSDKDNVLVLCNRVFLSVDRCNFPHTDRAAVLSMMASMLEVSGDFLAGRIDRLFMGIVLGFYEGDSFSEVKRKEYVSLFRFTHAFLENCGNSGSKGAWMGIAELWVRLYDRKIEGVQEGLAMIKKRDEWLLFYTFREMVRRSRGGASSCKPRPHAVSKHTFSFIRGLYQG